MGLKSIHPRPKGPALGDKKHVERYTFTYQKNFKVGRTPYRNQAHHLVPRDIFIKLFREQDRELLKQVDYNINNGRNIIFLPALVKDSYFHWLPYHNGSHPVYSEQVEADARKLLNKLQKYRKDKPCEEGDDVAGAIRDNLIRLQDDYWNKLKNAGPISVSDAA